MHRGHHRRQGRRQKETIYELADLAYHAMVPMVEMGISVDDVHKELASRHIIDHKVKQEKWFNSLKRRLFRPLSPLIGLGIYKHAVGRLVKIRTKNPHVLVKEEGGFSAISSSPDLKYRNMSAPVSRTPDEKSARFSKEAGIFPPIGFSLWPRNI